MTTIILVILGVLIAAAAALMVMYWGGDAWQQSKLDAEAGRLVSEGSQVAAALELFYRQEGYFPRNTDPIDDLLAKKYLTHRPMGMKEMRDPGEWKIDYDKGMIRAALGMSDEDRPVDICLAARLQLKLPEAPTSSGIYRCDGSDSPGGRLSGREPCCVGEAAAGGGPTNPTPTVPAGTSFTPKENSDEPWSFAASTGPMTKAGTRWSETSQGYWYAEKRDGVIVMHPGWYAGNTVTSTFTAPVAGTYRLSGQVLRPSSGCRGDGVYVNIGRLGNNFIGDYEHINIDLTMQMAKGEKLPITVDPNGNNSCDGTELKLDVTYEGSAAAQVTSSSPIDTWTSAANLTKADPAPFEYTTHHPAAAPMVNEGGGMWRVPYYVHWLNALQNGNHIMHPGTYSTQWAFTNFIAPVAGQYFFKGFIRHPGGCGGNGVRVNYGPWTNEYFHTYTVPFFFGRTLAAGEKVNFGTENNGYDSCDATVLNLTVERR